MAVATLVVTGLTIAGLVIALTVAGLVSAIALLVPLLSAVALLMVAALVALALLALVAVLATIVPIAAVLATVVLATVVLTAALATLVITMAADVALIAVIVGAALAFGHLAVRLAQHAGVMLGVLQKALLRDAVMGQLRVARQRQVFLDDLLGGATHLALGPRAVKDAIGDVPQRALAVRFATRAGF